MFKSGNLRPLSGFRSGTMVATSETTFPATFTPVLRVSVIRSVGHAYNDIQS